MSDSKDRLYEARLYPNTPTPEWPSIACDQLNEDEWLWRTRIGDQKFQIAMIRRPYETASMVRHEQARCLAQLAQFVANYP